SRCRTHARRARSARSPSGSTGSYGLLASGGPEFRVGGGRSLLGRPQLLACAGEVDRDALHLGDDAVERLAHEQVLAEQLVPPTRKDLFDDTVGVLALGVGVLADELAQRSEERRVGKEGR